MRVDGGGDKTPTERRGVVVGGSSPSRSAAALVSRGSIAGLCPEGGAGRARKLVHVVVEDRSEEVPECCERADEIRERDGVDGTADGSDASDGLSRGSAGSSSNSSVGETIDGIASTSRSASGESSGSRSGDAVRSVNTRLSAASPALDGCLEASGLAAPSALPRLLWLALRSLCCSSRASTCARAFSIAGESFFCSAAATFAGIGCFTAKAAFDSGNGLVACTGVAAGVGSVTTAGEEVSAASPLREGKRTSTAMSAAAADGAAKVCNVGHSSEILRVAS